MMEAAVIPPFERFYAEHQDEVFGVLVKRLGRQRAEDAFQETFLRALRAYSALRHGEHLRAWVLTIARNVAVDAFRREKPTFELEEPIDLPRRPAYAELEHLTGELPPTERAAVVLRYAYDLPYAAIGAALGSSEEAARQAASTGVRRIRSASKTKGARMTIPTDLDRRFREAAEREGLVDVAYDVADSPIGDLLVAATDRGLCRIAFRPDAALDELATDFGTRVLKLPKRLDRVRRELDEYFAGRRHEFDLETDLSPVPAFHQQVLHELARVPFGQVTTYGALAAKVGRPHAARAIGGAMNRNPIPIVLPCHRVIGSNGSLTGYAGGLDKKEALLRLEGVTF